MAEQEKERLNIYQKLLEVRKSCDFLKKENQGHGFKYVSSSQAITALRAKMDEMQLLLIPDVVEARVAPHKTKQGADWHFTEVFIKYTWVNAEKPEETITVGWYGQGQDDGEKGVGKALTYAEKYFLLKSFNIPTDKDDPSLSHSVLSALHFIPSSFNSFYNNQVLLHI